ncbi:hypothetical protein OUZ56_003534 [Daphnia magna]|uniref:Uncharacterized protein n=1 Tax=Daphnia magna TaxID=35525 RepID=A0ABR0A9A5_9CRUS|nr:hypothetical protein OUZ56_003534 [Daphnia magna]
MLQDTTGLPDQCNNITDTGSIESPQISLLPNSSELFTCHSPINSLSVPQSNASNRATVGLSKGSSGKDTSEFPDQCTTITDAVSTDSPTNFAHPIGVKNSVIHWDYHKSITGDVLTRSLIPDCAAGQLKIGSRNSCENFSSATPSPTPPFPPTPTPSPTPSFPPTPSPSPIHPVPLPLQISNAIKVNKDLVKTPEGMFFRGPQGKLLKVVRCTQHP